MISSHIRKIYKLLKSPINFASNSGHTADFDRQNGFIIQKKEFFDNIRQIIGDLYVWVYMDQSSCCDDASFPPSRYQYYY